MDSPPRTQPKIRVVAALIERDGKVLVTQRAHHSVLPSLWEFPGGKVEPNETDEFALERELRERLGVAGQVGGEFLAVEHAYADFVVDLHVYAFEIGAAALPDPDRGHGQRQYRWVSLAELPDLPFPDADQASVSALLRESPPRP